jgi:hypothetical protein
MCKLASSVNMSTSPSKGPTSCPAAPADHPAVERAPESPPGSIDAFIHVLDGRFTPDRVMSINEMNALIQAGWAGEYS